MTLFSIIRCYLKEKWISNFLHILLMAFGISLITAMLLTEHQIEQKFKNNSMGIDAVIGAKGSPLQLILSTIHHIDIPTGNIPLKRAEYIRKHPAIKKAIPLSLGDNFKGYRIIGTTADYIKHFNASLSAGSIWNASMQVVVGHDIGKKMGLQLGDYFIAEHGLNPDGHTHDNMPYQVVGILNRHNSVLDQLILTSLDSVWDMHHGETDNNDITALLVSYKTRNAAFSFPRMINANAELQAASPAFEMARLSKMIGIGEKTIFIFALLFMGFSITSIAVSLFNNVKERQYDLAIFRTLGASPSAIMRLTLLEAMIIILTGHIIGLLLGHGALEYFSVNGMTVNGFVILPDVWVFSGISFIISMIACLLPAYKAYNTDIAVLLENG